MAGQAQFRARQRLIGRVHPGGDIVLVAGAGNVDAEPVARAAMAGLAADPVGDLKPRSAQAGGNVVGMAIQAQRRGAGISETEIARDPLGAFFAQHGIGLGVLVLARPGEVLVLRDRGAFEPLDRAMARAACAR